MRHLMSGTAVSAKKIVLPLIIIYGLITLTSCDKDHKDVQPDVTDATSFTQVKTVASSAAYGATRVDPNLTNPWGIALSPSGTVWISAQKSGTSAVYNADGGQVLAAPTIPTAGATTGGHPTGQVFNSTTGFVIPGGAAAKFIFAGTDGVISGWSGGAAAVKMVDKSTTSAFTGLAIAADGAGTFLYAADFRGGKIVVIDQLLGDVTTKPFTDPGIPAGYSPFNIQAIGGQLYVTYAKVGTNGLEVKGAGLGYVDIYTAAGVLVKRLVSQGELNAPWGIAQAPANYFTGVADVTILVGNFGDGKINVYNSNGDYLGKMKSGTTDVAIEGLWAINFNADASRLFYAAGPNGETDGLFGYLSH